VHIGQCYTEINDQGRVDTMFRRYPLSAKAAAQKWGKRIPEKVQGDLASDNPWRKSEYLHVVLPRINGFDPQRADARGMPFEAYDICVDTKDIIGVGGYRQFPYTYARYTVNPKERYGRGPIMFLLPTIKSLNAMMRTHLKMGQLLVAPPLLARHDGVIGLGRKNINLKSQAVNWGGLDEQGRPKVLPLHTGGSLDISFEMMAELRQVINDACLVSLFQILVEHPNMTATEVLERAREKGILMAPTVGRLQTEMLGPQVEREVDIVLRQGLIRRPPQSFLQSGGEYEIEYESEATRMQGAAELIAIQRTIELLAPFIQVDPTVLAMFKPYEVGRRSARVQGVPMEVIRTQAELEEFLDEERQKQEAAMVAEAIPGGAKAIRDVAAAQKDLSSVPPPPGV